MSAVTFQTRTLGDTEWNVAAFKINSDLPFEDFKTHLLPLCKPEWVGKPLQYKRFDGGITNKLIGVYLEGNIDEMLLIRINGSGTDTFIRRDLEVCAMASLHKAGQIPPVYCQFNNGLCYGYQPGRVITLDEMADLEMARRTAKCLAKLHSTPIPTAYSNTNRLFEFYIWLDVIDDNSFRGAIPSREILKREAAEMVNVIKQLNCPLVFSHNDTLSGNIIYHEDSDKVYFIDFEYGGPNIRPYDIGNHFCEFAGLDCTNVDYNRYPNEDFQKKWIRMYLEAVAILEGKASDIVTQEEVHLVYQQVGKCALAAHLAWGIWALLQAQHSNIEFGYTDYAGIRLAEYFKQKDIFLSL